jgi:hypothetical protein
MHGFLFYFFKKIFHFIKIGQNSLWFLRFFPGTTRKYKFHTSLIQPPDNYVLPTVIV